MAAGQPENVVEGAAVGPVGSLVEGTAVSVGSLSTVSVGGTIVGPSGIGSGSRPVQAVKIKMNTSVKNSLFFIMFLKIRLIGQHRPFVNDRATKQRPINRTGSIFSRIDPALFIRQGIDALSGGRKNLCKFDRNPL